MTRSLLSLLLLLFCASAPFCHAAWGFGGGSDAGKVLLKDVQVLTLHHGKSTTGRRSSPVPQLTCVGGSAQGKFTPSVVQCYNRGWDGQDVQWECKSDMDNAFRFGNVEVVCEGYDYADDPYILKGSCGLEYTLDYTMEGHEKQKRQSHDYYGSSSNGYGGGGGGNYYQSATKHASSSGGGFGDLILLFVVGVVIYALYKTCFANEREIGDRQYSTTDSDYPGGTPGGGGWSSGRGGGGTGGARPGGHTGGGYDDASCGAGNRGGTGAGGTGGGGFWTGIATGGLMGYMFGNRGTGYGGYNRPYGANRGYGGWGSGWGNTGGGVGGGSLFGGGGGGFGGGSTGTRAASGFGGTRRR